MVYLVVQTSLQSELSDRGKEQSASGSLEVPRTANLSRVTQVAAATSPSADIERGVDDDDNDDAQLVMEEDEKELSMSVPNSPKLGHRMGRMLSPRNRLRSQSFDDVVSSANNEVIVPLSPAHNVSRSLLIPNLKVNSFGSASDGEFFAESSRSEDPCTVLEHPLGGDRSSCELDSNAEDTDFHGRSSHKPANQAQEAYQFRGGLFQRMRLSVSEAKQDNALSQPSSDIEETDSMTTSQKILAKFKKPPSLLRRVRGNLTRARGSQSSTASDDLASEKLRQTREARDQSKSVFISI